MQQFRFSWTFALTALGVALIAIGIGSFFSRPMVGTAFATGAFGGPPWQGGAHGGPWQGANLPPELAGLGDIPADQRFAHFRGVQVQLTDKDNRPVRVDVTPGTVTSSSATSVTIAGNDGASHTYTIDDKTMHHGDAAKQNDHVVVATINGSATATAVVAVDGNGFGPGPRGPWGR